MGRSSLDALHAAWKELLGDATVPSFDGSAERYYALYLEIIMLRVVAKSLLCDKEAGRLRAGVGDKVEELAQAGPRQKQFATPLSTSRV